MNKIQNYSQVLVLSGKGGTGKTTFTASISKLIKNKIVVDCDVDAANLFLLLKPQIEGGYEFYGGKKAVINSDNCRECGLCEEVCRFEAIKNYKVVTISCEGCGFCVRVCPEQAISFDYHKSGDFYSGLLVDKSKFFYAKLLPGEGNSGKLVSEIKKAASNNVSETNEWIIIDGPPGIGCPVNASLSGTDFVVIVTEPTLSGLHDLKRLIELLKTMKYAHGIIINKFDLNLEVTGIIKNIADENKINILGYLPFHHDFVSSLQLGKTIIEFNHEIGKQVENIWINITNQINNLKGITK
ncbi:MAG: ATP-binding protein [Melioribacteraceae bacterium]|nr:ATP-binding protein [Melioribacteraceae bacterium]